jgi:anaerobic magnesium-protoporphyrin IX monomethyl ester cyclase
VYRHVLCVYPYRIELERNAYYPPLGLELIAAALKPHASRIDVIDLRHERGRTADFVREDTDLVAFSVNWDSEIDFVVGEINSVPARIPTIVGGRHATEDPARWFERCPNLSCVVRGDGEEIVDELARGVPRDRIAGLSYRHEGAVVHGPNRGVGHVRDDLRPDRAARRYRYQVGTEGVSTGLSFDTISSSRGCPFRCLYCSFSLNPWGTKREWSARSAKAVVDELSEIDAAVVAFTDDNFTHDMDRVDRICDLIIARGIRKRYLVNARLEIARRPDVLRKMERAGFSMLLLGIESAQDKTLKSMRKGFDTRRIREYFKVLRRSNMILHGYFIVGNIGESVPEIRQIGRFAHELGVDSLGLCILRDVPHSGLKALVAESPGYYIDANGHVCSATHNARQLRQLRREINRRFYTPGHVLRIVKKGIRNRLLSGSVVLSLARLALRSLATRAGKRPPAPAASALCGVLPAKHET